jgi:hypothetical protein
VTHLLAVDAEAVGPVRALQLETYLSCPDWPPYTCTERRHVRAFTDLQAYIGYDAVVTSRATPTPSAGIDLSGPQPNPSRSVQRFSLSAPDGGMLEAFDAMGRRVWKRVLAPGAEFAEWSGEGVDGARVAAGIYVVVLRAAGQVRTRRVVRL